MIPIGRFDISQLGALLPIRDDHLFLRSDHGFLHGFRVSINDERIRRHLTAHNGFTQTKACIDYHLAAFTGRGIGGKQNPGDVSGDHLLYHDRHGNRTLFDLVFMAIADGLCGPERGPTIQHGRNQRIVTFDVKIGVLLSGKGQSRQIFGVCGGSDGNRWFAPERRVSVAQLPSDII